MLRAYLVSRWGEDPWARGSWSLIGRGGTPEDRRTLGSPVGERLRIAGEATHPARAGMTHGAYEQGLEAAEWAAGRGHRRVAVIGAGMAGLGAARRLGELGVHAEIWEARDRLGGRAAGAGMDGATFDLGANWLQQYEHNALARIAESAGLRTVATDFTDPVVLTGPPPSAAAGERVRRRLEAAPVEASMAGALGPLLDEEDVRRFVDAEIVMDSGAPLTWLSARYGFEPGVGEGDRWIVGSYRLLVDHLAAGLTAHLSHPVPHLAVAEDGVRFLDQRADAAIVTVPVGVLAAGGLTVGPPLPVPHREALSRLGMGRVEKVVLRFSTRFWPPAASGYYRVHGPGPGSICEWLDATAADGVPTMVGLFAGPWLAELWDGPDAEVARRAAALLSPR
ncbi:FAD-dependent oxidoreductase [Nucisporomicrobium flavum]|uniref:flavin monoamine oxidase family protein n=1 Tax=Nucisporomicrobium flavum TaxID=2785915 RepID=UPI003C2D129E